MSFKQCNVARPEAWVGPFAPGRSRYRRWLLRRTAALGSVRPIVGLLALAATLVPAPPASGSVERGISFEDARSQSRFEAYLARISSEPERFSEHLSTVERLRRSDVSYRIRVAPTGRRNVDGLLSTDGKHVLIVVSTQGGCGQERCNPNAVMAHELEHARQFDAGEFSFVRDLQSGEWRADVVTYDIGDEVRAWSAQLALAENRDFWDTVGGSTRPTLLSQFSLARTTGEQSDLLSRGPYRRVNRRVGCDVVFLAGTGLVPGQLVRTTGPRQVFGRVVKVV